MRKANVGAGSPAGPPISRAEMMDMQSPGEQPHARSHHIAESLVAALGVTQAQAYSRRQGWVEVARCIDARRGERREP